MAKKKKRDAYYLPSHEFYISKWYIRGYELYKTNMYRYENSTNGFDDDRDLVTPYKVEENIHDQVINAKIVKNIEYAFENYVDPSDPVRMQNVWQYGMGKLNLILLDSYEANDVKDQFKAWVYGFAKIHGIHTTREEW